MLNSKKSEIRNKISKYVLLVFLILILLFLIIQFINKIEYFGMWQLYISKFLLFLNYSIFSFWDKWISLFNIIAFWFIIFIGFGFWKIYKKFIYSFKRKNKSISHWTITILANIGYYTIITIVILTSLKIIWIDLSSFTMILSALSVWIGFGLQTIVSNFISGIILMFEQSIKEWDFIEVWNDLRWTVININMRSTTIRTNDNIDIVVPNQSFIENNIINWTHNDNVIRLEIEFWVAYWTTFEKAEEVVLTKLRESQLNYLDSGKMKPLIIMRDMWNSSIDLSLLVWIEWDDANIPMIAKWSFLKLIYKALNENNISIPFPQMDLHIKDSVPLAVNINNKK